MQFPFHRISWNFLLTEKKTGQGWFTRHRLQKQEQLTKPFQDRPKIQWIKWPGPGCVDCIKVYIGQTRTLFGEHFREAELAEGV